jgi:putative methyltransferase (TIGR04325 family)
MLGIIAMALLKRIGIRLLLALPASETIEGYEHPDIVDFVFQNSVREAASPKAWPQIAGATSVLDFGGAFGAHYRVAQWQEPNIRWAVVETPAMAARAQELATNRLQFFQDIESAAKWLGHVDVVHSSGALQYAPEPIAVLNKLCSLRARKMLWYRTYLSNDRIERSTQTALLSQNGPGFSFSRKRVRYSVTRIPRSVFIDTHSQYDLKECDQESFVFQRQTTA